MKPFRGRFGAQSGFTLIELLVVISIISLLSSVVLSQLNAAREKGRLGSAKQFAAQVDRVAGDRAVGIWELDECSGAAAADRSGNGNNASLSGSPSWLSDTPDSTGCSLSLNGSTQGALVPHAPSLDLTGDMTFSIWFYANASSWPASWQSLMSKGNATPRNYFMNVMSGESVVANDCSDQTGGFQFGYHDGTTFRLVDINASSVPTQRWVNAVGVISANGANRDVKLYIDGQLRASALCSNAPTSNTVPLSIGSIQNSIEFFNGRIDKVRLFEKSLTASEVGRMYAAEAPKYEFAYE
ncbi:MAG: prepilin-type N-terminal cleavage/methylation domain-containing protein [Candidatus Taylorbacteria bacterium]|nr:prepilin-type N-terminal cleavage/methylation domain-containing protein [Candidatus Taylorbacteria bacterium]